MFRPTHIFLLLTMIRIISGLANNSYANCLQIAAHFATTVSNRPVVNIRNTTGINVTCPQLASLSWPGSFINGVCVFQQKLFVTCVDGSTVRKRVQTNGLARGCALVSNNTLIVERNVDFEVNFNPDVSVNSPNQSPNTVAVLNSLICNKSIQLIVPATSVYTQSAISMPLNALSGIAVDGVNIINVNNLEQVDAFYPPTIIRPEGADQCLSHPAENGEYHYHIASGCLVNPSQGNLTRCSPIIGCLKNVSSYLNFALLFTLFKI